MRCPSCARSYDSAFTFIYSPRTGTGAAKMPNQVPEDVSSRAFRNC
ncbi:MAG: hypothetical protein ACLT74_04395 [Christensenellales bacterium]